MEDYADYRDELADAERDQERRDELLAERVEDDPSAYFVELAALELEAQASFTRWLESGGKKRWPDHPRLEAVWPAFWQGWQDQRTGISDFKRRSMAQDERDAYMSARFLSSAHRLPRRGGP